MGVVVLFSAAGLRCQSRRAWQQTQKRQQQAYHHLLHGSILLLSFRPAAVAVDADPHVDGLQVRHLTACHIAVAYIDGDMTGIVTAGGAEGAGTVVVSYTFPVPGMTPEKIRAPLGIGPSRLAMAAPWL